MAHIPVLLHSSIDGLAIRKGDTIVDATFGEGGHTKEIVSRFGTEVSIIGIDLDPLKILEAHTLGYSNLKVVEDNFRNLTSILDKLQISKVDRILIDLGFGSHTIEDSGKGFSFQKDEPLLMTYTNTIRPDTLTAKDIVNRWDEENLKTIFSSYGEERYAGRIARAIVESRNVGPIETSGQLADIVWNAVPVKYRHGRIHPATRTFQAIRITVNDELGALQQILNDGFERLVSGGRYAVIAFHSLEDRLVKRFFKEKHSDGTAQIITKKPITASVDEITHNPRARSAKLRILEKK